MSDGLALLLILVGALLWGKLCGIRNQLARIADICERAEKRTNGARS